MTCSARETKPGQLNYSTFEKDRPRSCGWSGFSSEWVCNCTSVQIGAGAGDGGRDRRCCGTTSSYLLRRAISMPAKQSRSADEPQPEDRFPNLPLLSDIIRIDRPNTTMVLFGPPGLPAEILNVLSRELLKAQASSDVRDALARLASSAGPQRPRRKQGAARKLRNTPPLSTAPVNAANVAEISLENSRPKCWHSASIVS